MLWHCCIYLTIAMRVLVAQERAMVRWRTFMEKYGTPLQAAADTFRVAGSGGSGNMSINRSPISQYFR